jgi:hypothetical protein
LDRALRGGAGLGSGGGEERGRGMGGRGMRVSRGEVDRALRFWGEDDWTGLFAGGGFGGWGGGCERWVDGRG